MISHLNSEPTSPLFRGWNGVETYLLTNFAEKRVSFFLGGDVTTFLLIQYLWSSRKCARLESCHDRPKGFGCGWSSTCLLGVHTLNQKGTYYCCKHSPIHILFTEVLYNSVLLLLCSCWLEASSWVFSGSSPWLSVVVLSWESKGTHTPPMQPPPGLIQVGVVGRWALKISMILRKWTGEIADSHWGVQTLQENPFSDMGKSVILTTQQYSWSTNRVMMFKYGWVKNTFQKMNPISSYSSVTRAQHTFQIERSQTWSGVIIIPTKTMHY